MALDGQKLKDERVKLFLSSRAEMQKIIEETRQKHLAMQAGAPGALMSMPSIPSGGQLPLSSSVGSVGGHPFPGAMSMADHLNPSASNVLLRDVGNNGHSFHRAPTDLGNGHQYRPGGAFDQPPFHSQQQQQPPYHLQQQHQPSFNQFQRMPLNAPQHQNFPPHLGAQQQNFAQHGGGHRMRGPGDGAMGGFGRDMHHDVRASHGPGPRMMNRFSRERRDSPEFDRGGNGFRGRADRFRRDRDSSRRGRRTRSRSRSASPRGRRDRRHRSRSDSRERRRNSRGRDRDSERNGKSSRSGSQPTESEQVEISQPTKQQATASDVEPEPNTSIQLRLLDGDLTYRDLRDYFDGINIPNQFIKMINSFDGRRFGLAYIRFLTQADKQAILSRQNG